MKALFESKWYYMPYSDSIYVVHANGVVEYCVDYTSEWQISCISSSSYEESVALMESQNDVEFIGEI